MAINIINHDKYVPRCLVGIKQNGQKFAIVLNGLPLEANEWHNFIKVVLDEEECVAYGYSSMMGAYNEETDSVQEELHVGVATKESAIFGNWDVNREKQGEQIQIGEPHIYPNQLPERSPMTWDIVGAKVSVEEREMYLKIWSEIQEKVRWFN